MKAVRNNPTQRRGAKDSVCEIMGNGEEHNFSHRRLRSNLNYSCPSKFSGVREQILEHN